jgi:hypothetical protein
MNNLNGILQYQLSTGTWKDCGDRTEEFLLRCEKFNGCDDAGRILPAFRAKRNLTRDEVIYALTEEECTLRNDSDDWYSNCRIKPDEKPAQTVELVKCNCGHSVPKFSVMSASMGTSCPDCYDRMSS